MTLLYILRPGRSQSVPATTVGFQGNPWRRHRSQPWHARGSFWQSTDDCHAEIISDWWFGTLFFLTFHSVGNVIIPTDFHIFQRDWNHQPDQWGIIEYNKEIPDKFQIIRYYRIILVTWSSRFWRIYKNTYIREKKWKTGFGLFLGLPNNESLALDL